MADYIGAIAKLTADTAMGMPGLEVPLKPALKQDDTLQTALDRALTSVTSQLSADRALHPELPTDLEAFGFAVVDLTPGIAGFGPDNPAYAGRNDTHLFAIGSMAKLLPLYVAHVLRAAGRDLAMATGVTSITTLGPLMRNHLQRIGAADDTFPLIEDMFTFVDGRVDFTPGGGRWPGVTDLISDLDLASLHAEDHATGSTRVGAVDRRLADSLAPATRRDRVRAQLADVAFREQLRLMAGWSNNVSASIVIQAIGFPCLWQLANRSGLFRSGGWERLRGPRKGRLTDPGGIFLGRDYANNFWTRRPLQAPVRNEKPSQAGNARAVAQLMTSLAHELIDDEARISMWEMLRKDATFDAPTDRGESSPIGFGMALAPGLWAPNQARWLFNTIPAIGTSEGDALRDGDLAASKIGLVDSTPLTVACNTLLVRSARTLPAGIVNITAVLVGICSWQAIDSDFLLPTLNKFGEAMAAELDARHS